MDHVYDFYKPTLRTNSYPIVDGKLSVYCYMKAMHLCYVSFKTKYEKMVFLFFSLFITIID